MNAEYFWFLVGYAAFVDTIAISVDGIPRKYPRSTARYGRNLPIGSGASNYARSQQITCCLTGNPVEVRHGRFHRRRVGVPKYCVILRSEHAPITLSSALATLNAIFRNGYRATVSRFELTFDTHFPLRFVARHAICRLRMRKRRTSLYFGTSRSSRQVRVYRKASAVVRIEFVLRRDLLRAHGIKSLVSIPRVTQLDLLDWFRLREVRHGYAVPGCRSGTECPTISMRKLRRFCVRNQLSFSWWTRQCPEERLLSRMLARFIW